MIEVRNVTKVFRSGRERVLAVRDISLAVPAGTFYVLLGASGSGKTTMLRSIAGLETPDMGEIIVDGVSVFASAAGIRVSPAERPIGMMFQSYALWPHMDVFRNVAFPLRYGRRRIPKAQIPARVERVLSLLHLGDLTHRPVTALSGGQQQRVALARALALEPKALLMDEPLSNLDAKLRAEVRVELRDLTRRLAITTVYVTHDQVEALALADTIGIMDGGRLVEEGPPSELYRNPKSLTAARFLGEMNFFPGTIKGIQSDWYEVAIGGGTVKAVRQHSFSMGEKVLVGVRPEDTRVVSQPKENCIPVRVDEVVFLGECNLHRFQVNGQTTQLKLPNEVSLARDEKVFLELPPGKCRIFRG